MFWSRNLKPEKLKRDVHGNASTRILLNTAIFEEPAEDWPHLQKDWGSSFKFNMVPVLRASLIREHISSSGRVISCTGVYIDGEKSLVPYEHVRLSAAVCNMETHNKEPHSHHDALRLAADWNGTSWSFDQYYGFWLVTAEGEDVPVVVERKKRSPIFRKLAPKFKILSPPSYRYPRPFDGTELRLERKETGNTPLVELIFAEGNGKIVLLDTRRNHLTTLFAVLQDTTGWREKVLARTIGELRKEIRNCDSSEKALGELLNSHKTALCMLIGSNISFFDKAILLLDATKSISRHKAFADLRKLLEVGKTLLTRMPSLYDDNTLPSKLKSAMDEIPDHLK